MIAPLKKLFESKLFFFFFYENELQVNNIYELRATKHVVRHVENLERLAAKHIHSLNFLVDFQFSMLAKEGSLWNSF